MALSIPKPPNGLKETPDIRIRKRVPFDGGYRFIKWIDPNGRVQIIPSVIKELESWEDAEPSECSVVLETDGHRYVIGQLAADLGGKPVFEGDKCELAWLLTLVAIEPKLGQTAVLIETMLVALPDSRNQQALAGIKRVEGTREFTRNGQSIIATVRSVEPVDETRAAYRFAKTKGFFQYSHKINGVLDLGGGTGIGRLYTPTDVLIRQADVIVPGTYQLAQKIAAALTPQLGYSPSLSLIMDAIADGTFDYGTTGVNFQPIFLKCRDAWISADIRAKLKTSWTQQLNDLGEVLIIGGSASLAQPLVEATKGRFKIAQHPHIPNFSQLINLHGMAME